jgi:hypothetical protein
MSPVFASVTVPASLPVPPGPPNESAAAPYCAPATAA